ncbi:zinc-dependent alcohol dehydrogenase [Pseudaestuariivita atlantica]|uniref:Sorbitol dehydrogenase n=1 Tax=Pseudaestuariivita atlantica TaxID=1317121 RepID=A0A0L1JRQ0_9RHOB|nr:alcohol dehydrogenase catalytic domain-containing protein [Pseudaestuariivita atlantica]KNG94073.1 sorbitol dehydrogenase [Pseudaestuariivita atlantica]
MKALVYDGPEQLGYREVAEAGPQGPDEVLVRVDTVGICGSDMHAYLGHDERRPAPLILGHEAAGLTADGRRVTVNPLVTCGTCEYCASRRENLCTTRQIISMPPREGAFAEAIAMPERNLVTVPDAYPLDKAALAEPLAVCWHAVRLAAPEGKTALVIGGGAIGVGAALALIAQGSTQVTLVEPNPARLAFLADQPFAAMTPDAVAGAFDIVIDAVGYDGTRASACERVKPGGIIVHVGLGSATGGLDIRRITLQEITFLGTYTYTAQDFRDTCAAMFDGRLGPLDWTETRALADGAAAFADLRAGRVAAPKLLLKP